MTNIKENVNIDNPA